MSFTDFTRNDNKSIIWGLLQEGGVFNDIPNSSFENVKRIFEASIYSMKPVFDTFFENNDEGDDNYDNKASEMIMNSNKTVIKKMIQELGKFKVSRMPTENHNVQHTPSNILPVPPRYNSSGKKPKIEEIYRADDLQKSRMSEIEVRLKEKQEEMDSMLNNKKPVDIDFTDKKVGGLNDVKLASSDMERLIAEALASRQQELDHLKNNIEQNNMNGSNDKNAEDWLKGTSVNKDVKRPVQTVNKKNIVDDSPKKSVTFNDDANVKVHYENVLDTSGELNESHESGTSRRLEVSNNQNNQNNEDGIELSILSKLKRNNIKVIKSESPTNDIISHSNSLLYKPIPLDTIMGNNNHGDDDDGGDSDEYEGMDGDDNGYDAAEYKGREYNIYPYSKKKRTGEAGEYKKLEEKIIKIQNEIESIKTMQEKILSILTNDNREKNIVNL
jgi:hypothetical protein